MSILAIYYLSTSCLKKARVRLALDNLGHKHEAYKVEVEIASRQLGKGFLDEKCLDSCLDVI